MPSEDKLMPVLVVEDVDASVAFYRDVLGFDEGTPLEVAEGERFVSMTYGSSTIGLTTPRGLPSLPPGRGSALVTVHVRDIAGIHRVIRSRSSDDAIGPLHDVVWGPYFDATDPAGHVLRFFERSDATRSSSF